MNITALLSWYDEDPTWLTRMVRSLEGVVDHVCALDGAYELFDGGRARSSDAEHEAIVEAAKAAGIGWSLHTPQSVWRGNEVMKRNELFRIGERYTEPDDWYMVVDADYEVTDAPYVRGILEATLFDVGAVELTEPGHALGPVVFPTFPMFFRAIRGITCYTNHFTYVTPAGRRLWGDAKKDRLEPRAMTGVRVTHYSEKRPFERRDRAKRYYRARDDAGIEEIPVERFKVSA